jgi:rhodanese-related sulfurtransferase
MTRIRFITLEELLEMKVNNDDFTLIEALPEEAFKQGHIPGAVNIPSENIAQKESQVDKAKPVVTYCANYACQASTVAAKKLIDLGFEDVRDFKAGKQAWKDADLELDT